MNGFSISIPFSKDNNPMGIMLNGITNNDDQLLNNSIKVEAVLSK